MRKQTFKRPINETEWRQSSEFYLTVLLCLQLATMASLKLLAPLTSLTVASIVQQQVDWLLNYGAISKTLTAYRCTISVVLKSGTCRNTSSFVSNCIHKFHLNRISTERDNSKIKSLWGTKIILEACLFPVNSSFTCHISFLSHKHTCDSGM